MFFIHIGYKIITILRLNSVNQWLNTSKTCPKCRHKCSGAQKLYFDKRCVNEIGDDFVLELSESFQNQEQECNVKNYL